MTIRKKLVFLTCLAFVSATACAGKDDEEKTGCNTADDCAEGQTCRDFECAELTGGTGGTTSCSDQPGAGGEDGLLLGADECEAQCVEAKGTCEGVDMGFECRANCAHTGYQVEEAGCLVEWDKIFRCGRASGEGCGVCGLCEPEVRGLQACFRAFCEENAESEICLIPQ